MLCSVHYGWCLQAHLRSEYDALNEIEGGKKIKVRRKMSGYLSTSHFVHFIAF